jgi:hypothetical protein
VLRKHFEYSGLDGAFLTHYRSGGEGRFGLQWYAPAIYPKPPGPSSSKITINPDIPEA